MKHITTLKSVNFILPWVLGAFILFTSCGQNNDTEAVPEEEDLIEQPSEERRPSLTEEVEELAAELEENATTKEQAKEKQIISQRIEAIKQAQEASELKEKNCEQIIDEYEQAIRNYMKGEGSQQDYTRFNNDPFFVDCRNQNEEYRNRVRELRAELREFSKKN